MTPPTDPATPPVQPSSRVRDEACPTCGGPVVTMGEGMTHWYRPAPEPAHAPTEQGPTRGDLADLLDDLANETALSGTLAYRHAAQLVRTSGSRIDVDPPEKEGLITPPHGEARGRDSAAPTEQGDLAARFEALADLALKKCEEECLSDGAPNPFREEMAQAKAYRYAAELARDYAHTHSGTAGARVDLAEVKKVLIPFVIAAEKIVLSDIRDDFGDDCDLDDTYDQANEGISVGALLRAKELFAALEPAPPEPERGGR